MFMMVMPLGGGRMVLGRGKGSFSFICNDLSIKTNKQTTNLQSKADTMTIIGSQNFKSG